MLCYMCVCKCTIYWLCATPHETATPLVIPAAATLSPPISKIIILVHQNQTLLLLLFFNPLHALNVVLLLMLHTISWSLVLGQ